MAKRALYWIDSRFWWKDVRLIMKDITIIWGLTKALHIVISANLGRRFCNFRRSPKVMFVFKNTIFRYLWSIDLVSSIIPRWFWDDDWEPLELLNSSGGSYISFALRLKMTSWACLVGSELKLIFHWKAQLFIVSESLSRSFADV